MKKKKLFILPYKFIPKIFEFLSWLFGQVEEQIN